MRSLLFVTITFCLVFLTTGCGGNAGDGKCAYNTPVAIFEGVDGLEQHQFEGKGQESVEKITVPSMNMRVELYQSGCDQLEQEYRIFLNEPYELNTPANICAMHIANILQMISEKDLQKLGALQQWADAIRADAEHMVYNDRVQLSNSSVYMQIDKTHQSNSAMLSAIFSQ